MDKKRLKEFWNKEYKDPEFFALSDRVSSDLERFVRFCQREYGDDVFRPGLTVLDLGCGNGRNTVYFARHFDMKGIGYDISEEGIKQAKIVAAPFSGKVYFEVRSISDPFPLEDQSVDVVLDLMASHFLIESERAAYLAEVLRVLVPGGLFLFKSFYGEGDMHAKKLIKEHGTKEKNSYIHPRLKVYEYVWTDRSIEETFLPHFTMLKKEASHKHFTKGRPNKRRSVTCYFEKKS